MQIDLANTFITYLNTAQKNPLETLSSFDLSVVNELSILSLDVQPSSVSMSSTAIVAQFAESALRFEGSGFSPSGSFEQFMSAVENGTASGTLERIEFTDGDTVVFAMDISSNALTFSSEIGAVTIEGQFPTSFLDVVYLLDATLAFIDDFAFVSSEAQAEYELVLARHDIDAVTLEVAGREWLSVSYVEGGARIDLEDGFRFNVNGTFEDGFAGGLAGLDLMSAMLGFGEYYDADGITIESLDLTTADGTEFFTITGPFVEGSFLEDAPVFLNGRAFAESELGSGDVNDDMAVQTDAGGLLAGLGGADRLLGAGGEDLLIGGRGNDTVEGGAGNDTIEGGNGADNLIGGAGNDLIMGGADAIDRRDNIYGGLGNDTIDGGYGNDMLRGDAGDDLITGGFGGDTVIGGTGNDTMTGSALGDLLFGGDGSDFINGGFGHDRINGGDGADRFFHLGIFDHGSDWVQDYDAAEGDTLVFAHESADVAQFQINYASTLDAGEKDVAEAFVIYRPTGQILWALIDGAGEDEINIVLGGETFDLMA